MKNADVDPIIRENIAVTGGSGSDCTVDIKVYKDPVTNQYAAATWSVNNHGSGYKDSDTINIPAITDLGFDGVNGVNIVTDFSEFVSEPWPEGKI